MKAFLSVFTFIVAYYFIATEKVNKTVVALLGAFFVLLFKLVTFEQAVAAVDFNVIFLLVGMMLCVQILSQTGFFEWVAISVAKFARGNATAIILLLLAVTAFLSAWLDNVTTIILLVPLTILIMQLLELSPLPLVILQAIISNLGGTATLIGDPPNIIIGSHAGLSFNDFLVHLGPVVLIVSAVFLITVYYLWAKKIRVSKRVKLRVIDAVPHLAIVDRKNMRRALVILGFIFLGFLSHEWLDLPPGMIALFGGVVMMMVCRTKGDETFMHVEWGVIFFFIGMFMMISAMEVNGVIIWLAERIIEVAGNNLFLVCLFILWGSAIFSAILDNIPFVIAMVPLVEHFSRHFVSVSGITDASWAHLHIEQPLFWALALGACLGGNGTLIGASANIVMAKICERNHYPVTFKKFLRYGIPFLLQSMLISSVYLWLRYFFH